MTEKARVALSHQKRRQQFHAFSLIKGHFCPFPVKWQRLTVLEHVSKPLNQALMIRTSWPQAGPVARWGGGDPIQQPSISSKELMGQSTDGLICEGKPQTLAKQNKELILCFPQKANVSWKAGPPAARAAVTREDKCHNPESPCPLNPLPRAPHTKEYPWCHSRPAVPLPAHRRVAKVGEESFSAAQEQLGNSLHVAVVPALV